MKAIVNPLRGASACALLLLSLPLALHAGVNTFTGAGPEGGDIRHVEFQQGDGTKAVAMTPAGLYRGTGGGTDWSLVNGTIASTPFSIHPNDADIVYVVNENGDILRSTNGGTSLTILAGWPDDQTATAIDVGVDGVVYAGTAAGKVFRSGDQGDTWSDVSTGLPGVRVDGVVVDPTNSAIVYANFSSVPRGVYRTSNSGGSWQSRNSGFGGADDALTVSELAIDPEAHATLFAATDAGLYLSTNSGTGWQLPTTPIDAQVESVAVDPADGSSNVYAGGPGGLVYKSTDGGFDWQAPTTIGPGTVRSIAASVDGATVLAGTTSGMNRSPNASASWDPANSGIVASDVVALVSDPEEAGQLIASANNGLFASTKSGAVWTNLTDFGGTSLVIDSADSATIYAALNGVQKSVDGGITWTSIDSLTADISLLAFARVDADHEALYAADTKASDIYVSTDGGANWDGAGTAVVDSGIDVLLVDALDGNTVYLGSDSDGAWRTNDAGAHWTPLTGLAATRVSGLVQDPSNASTVIAATDQGVFRSTDEGDTWTSTGADDVIESLTIDPRAPEILYGSGVGVVRSLDGGATWAAIPEADPQSWVSNEIVLDPRVSYRVYAGTATQGVQVIDLAHDLQATMTGPEGDVGLNADFEYDVTVTNAGPGPAPRVELTQALPSSRASFLGATPDQGTCSLDGGVLSCDLGVLAEGQSVGVVAQMESTDPGVISSTVTVSDFDSELAQGDNTVTSADAHVTQLYDLAALINAPATVTVNSRLTYTASVANNGPNAANGVQLVHEIPVGTTFVSAVTDANCTRDVTVLTCTIGGLSSGESGDVEITVDVDDTGTLTSTSTVSANGGTDSNPDNDSATGTTTSNGGSSGGGGGGAIDWLTLGGLGLGVAWRRRLAWIPARRS
jgi:uncharacterized repeat protein (TIGR01451 family)